MAVFVFFQKRYVLHILSLFNLDNGKHQHLTKLREMYTIVTKQHRL